LKSVGVIGLAYLGRWSGRCKKYPTNFQKCGRTCSGRFVGVGVGLEKNFWKIGRNLQD